MNLGLVVIARRRKEGTCEHCQESLVGDLYINFVMRSNGCCWTNKVHLRCIEEWAEEKFNLNEERRAENKGGRPPGGRLKELRGIDQEVYKKRQSLLRRRIYLLQCIEKEESRERLKELNEKRRWLEKQIGDILPIQIKKPGRRSSESRQILEKKLTRV